MVGAGQMVLERGKDSVVVGCSTVRRVLSTADLELEFGSAIRELELGLGLRSGTITGAGETMPAWSRLFTFFH
jgi:hypothetical protein